MRELLRWTGCSFIFLILWLALGGCGTNSGTSTSGGGSSSGGGGAPLGASRQQAGSVQQTAESKRSQELGIKLIKALMAHPQLKGSKISVGTSKSIVTLNGTVTSAAQKKQAENLTKQQAKGYKIVNQLQVVASAPNPPAKR